ncbi:adenine nucleotide alpha hydrolase family protein [archaeon]|nr:adenine nucleotide alpha hydrolase family protein [archaeon]MBT7128201.1 adenine nucleotide alpha hydrolase family protein [archaeon]
MDIEGKVVETVEEYDLMVKKDKVVVALSGGKDSTSVLYILKKLGYDVHGLMIDLYLGEWSEIHKKNMTRFCEELDVPLTVVDLKKEIGQGICFVKAVLAKKKGLTGCTVCGIIKRWVLNKWARKLGADVIVTGHNLDDEAQNVLMNYLKGNVSLGAGLAPMTGGSQLKIVGGSSSESSGGSELEILGGSASLGACVAKNQEPRTKNQLNFVQRVKPLFFVPESEVRKFAEDMKFDILYDRCPCAFGTYRVDTRGWMVENMKDEDKLKVVEGFMESVGGMKKDDREVRSCEVCGEVSRGKVCKFCEIVQCV